MPLQPPRASSSICTTEKSLSTPAPPYSSGMRRAQEAVRARLAPDRAVDVALLFPGCVERRDLVLEKLRNAVAEGFVVGREEGACDHGRLLGQVRRLIYARRPIFAKHALGEMSILAFDAIPTRRHA